MVATTISFNNPGTVPPVFVAGSFTEWQPVELDGPAFSKDFDLRPGHYQYKFRLGTGDWWVCDQSQPQGPDDSGNLNNILTVEPSAETAKEQQPSPQSVSQVQAQKSPSVEKEAPQEAVPAANSTDDSPHEPIFTEDKPTENGTPKMNGSAKASGQDAPKTNGHVAKPVAPTTSQIQTKVETANDQVREVVKEASKKVAPESSTAGDKQSSDGFRRGGAGGSDHRRMAFVSVIDRGFTLLLYATFGFMLTFKYVSSVLYSILVGGNRSSKQ